jgi:hypothetical protein
VTMLGEDLPLWAGRVRELVYARSAAEAALLAVTDWRTRPGDKTGDYG